MAAIHVYRPKRTCRDPLPTKSSLSAQFYCPRSEGHPCEQSTGVWFNFSNAFVLGSWRPRYRIWSRSLVSGQTNPAGDPAVSGDSALRTSPATPVLVIVPDQNVNARCIPAGRTVSRTFVRINGGTSYVVLNDFRITRVSYGLSHGPVVMYDNITTGYRVCVSCYCRRARRRGRYYNFVPP